MHGAVVLVVDDDVAALAATRAALTAAGYVVDEAYGGRGALRRVVACPPDVLITEILLPEGDGIELISAVRCTRPDLSIIAVTEHRFLCDLDLLELASKVGANAVLNKPLATDRLLATVARLAGPDAPPC